ncbi:MAG: methyltransferase domain-containing protein [Victivallales bacterium]
MKLNLTRDPDLTKRIVKMHKQDIKKFISSPDTRFVKVKCPACDSSRMTFHFEKNGFKFSKCENCETLFINPRPDIESLERFYNQASCHDLWYNEVMKKSEGYRLKQIFIPRVKRIISLCKKHKADFGTLLDIGAGNGILAEEMMARHAFKRVVALEMSKVCCDECRKKGIETIESPVENVSMKNVSVITAFELLEHIYAPEGLLKTCHGILKKNGLLILTTPNIKGFDLLTLGKLSNNIAGPNHLNYFNPKSLEIILEKAGFSVLEILTPGKLDAEIVRSKILSGEYKVDGNPFLKEVLIDNWDGLHEAFQDFLSKNRLSSHLWAVAIKK